MLKGLNLVPFMDVPVLVLFSPPRVMDVLASEDFKRNHPLVVVLLAVQVSPRIAK